jgi:hypothetical protein
METKVGSPIRLKGLPVDRTGRRPSLSEGTGGLVGLSRAVVAVAESSRFVCDHGTENRVESCNHPMKFLFSTSPSRNRSRATEEIYPKDRLRHVQIRSPVPTAHELQANRKGMLRRVKLSPKNTSVSSD